MLIAAQLLHRAVVPVMVTERRPAASREATADRVIGGLLLWRRYIVLCIYVEVIMLTVLFLAFHLENGSGKALRRTDLGCLGRFVGAGWDWLTRPEPDRGEIEALG